MSFAILWNATVCFSKLSVLAIYTALIPMESMSRYARILGAMIITWNVADIIAALLICRPLAKNWNFTLPETCGSQPSFYFAMGVINLITDAIMILLPMPYLYRLRLAWRRKLAVMALLSIGVG
jgi:sorbitol-specific phosphotransferase system component IIC